MKLQQSEKQNAKKSYVALVTNEKHREEPEWLFGGSLRKCVELLAENVDACDSYDKIVREIRRTGGAYASYQPRKGTTPVLVQVMTEEVWAVLKPVAKEPERSMYDRCGFELSAGTEERLKAIGINPHL